MHPLTNSFEKIKHHLFSDLRSDLKQETRDFDWDNYLKFYSDHLSEALESENVLVFSDFLSWSMAIGRHHSIKPLQENTLTDKLAGYSCQYLSPKRQQMLTRFLLQCHKDTVPPETQTGSMLHGNSPTEILASDYFHALITGNQKAANDLVMNAAEQGMPVKDLYLKVFQPGLQEVGRLWQQNKISVGQEHLFSAATQMIISRLYPKIFNSRRKGKMMIATAVGGELHEIGVRMVADFFEMDGWDTLYLGANCPNSEIIKELQQHKPHLLAISVNLASHIGNARKLIQQIRTHPEINSLNIITGGRIYTDHPEFFSNVEADSFACDAEEAVLKANHMTR